MLGLETTRAVGLAANSHWLLSLQNGFWVENLENRRLCVEKYSFYLGEISFVHKGTTPRFEGREDPLIAQKSWMQGKQREAVQKLG